MRRYLCIVRLPTTLDSPSLQLEREAVLAELREAGHLAAATELEPAVVVRVRAGHLSVAVADAEDAGTAAAFVLDARDLNEAIQLAARDPGARHGTVEVRPLRWLG